MKRPATAHTCCNGQCLQGRACPLTVDRCSPLSGVPRPAPIEQRSELDSRFFDHRPARHARFLAVLALALIGFGAWLAWGPQ